MTNEQKDAVYYGPTVIEATQSRIRQVLSEIDRLNGELKVLRSRLQSFAGSSMLEAERVAEASEPFQTTQLP